MGFVEPLAGTVVGLDTTSFDVSPDIAPKAAEIRAIHQVRTPDAIQLATAFLGGATHFLTNDRALRKYTEIQILVVADLA